MVFYLNILTSDNSLVMWRNLYIGSYLLVLLLFLKPFCYSCKYVYVAETYGYGIMVVILNICISGVPLLHTLHVSLIEKLKVQVSDF